MADRFMGQFLQRIAIGLLLLLVTVILLGNVPVQNSEQVLLPATATYQTTQHFTPQGIPDLRQPPALKATPDITLWGTWDETKTPGEDHWISPPFPAPWLLGLWLSGWPSALGNQIVLQRVDTHTELPLKTSLPGTKWQLVRWILPPDWWGQLVQLRADDRNSNPTDWFGLSSPLAGSVWTWLRSPIGGLNVVPAYGLQMALLLIAGTWLAFLLQQALHLPLALGSSLIFLVNSGIGYGAFWLYCLNPLVGLGSSLVWMGVSGVLTWTWRRQLWQWLRSWDIWFPVGLVAVVGLFYLAILYISNPGTAITALAQNRFLLGMPPDNILPKLFAGSLYQGNPPSPLFSHWLSSDRPPLQTGIVLLHRPLLFWTNFDRSYQSLSTILQCAWIPALWALMRASHFSSRQLAVVLTCCIGSGFFLFNSLFVWPKLLAGSFLLVALALLVSIREAQRRPTIAETATMAGAAGLALLSHGSAIFTLLVMPLLLVSRWSWPKARSIVVGCLVFLLLLAPWVAYQKLYDPPGDRLPKWHLAGVGIEAPDPRPLGQALKDAYSHLSFHQWLDYRWQNLSTLVDRVNQQSYITLPPRPTYPGLMALATAEQQRAKEFFHLLPGLGILNLGWLIGGVFLVRSKQRLQIAALKSLFGVTIGSLILWILLIFLPGNTIIHQSSYAMVMVLFMMLAGVIAQAPLWIGWVVVGWQLLSTVWIWVITPTIALGSTWVTAPNLDWIVIAILAGMAVGKLVWPCQGLTALTDEPSDRGKLPDTIEG